MTPPERIRLLVLDLDGTLLNPEKQLPEGAARYVARLHEAGIRITLATGRAYPSARRYAWLLGLTEPLIVLDGAQVRTDTRVLHEQPLDPEDVALTVSLLERERHRVFAAFSTTDHTLVPPNDRTDVSLKRWGIEPLKVAWHEVAQYPILRVRFVGDRALLESLWQQLQEQGRHLAAHLYPSEVYGYFYVDMGHRAATKGNALARLQERLQIAPEETLAVGDFYNDLELFRRSGVRVAMANAVDPLKAQAHWVTRQDHRAGGVLEVFRWLLGEDAPAP